MPGSKGHMRSAEQSVGISKGITEQKRKEERKMGRNYGVIAHTGCMGTQMNSLESIKEALEYEVDYIEVDIRFGADGPILTHNPPEKGRKYLLLREVLPVIQKSSGVKIALDLKEWDRVGELADMLEEYGMKDRAVYLGNFMEDMAHMKDKGGDIPCFPNVYPEQVRGCSSQELEQLAERAECLGAQAVGMNYIAVTKEVVEAFHRHNMEVSVWTVDEMDGVRRMTDIGVDFITSDRLDYITDRIFREI